MNPRIEGKIVVSYVYAVCLLGLWISQCAWAAKETSNGWLGWGMFWVGLVTDALWLKVRLRGIVRDDAEMQRAEEAADVLAVVNRKSEIIGNPYK